ncbi:MAG: hypothetical protein ABJH45_05885 [Paracoccaceae bacterium]
MRCLDDKKRMEHDRRIRDEQKTWVNQLLINQTFIRLAQSANEARPKDQGNSERRSNSINRDDLPSGIRW